jgi:hypothetical protein
MVLMEVDELLSHKQMLLLFHSNMFQSRRAIIRWYVKNIHFMTEFYKAEILV